MGHSRKQHCLIAHLTLKVGFLASETAAINSIAHEYLEDKVTPRALAQGAFQAAVNLMMKKSRPIAKRRKGHGREQKRGSRKNKIAIDEKDWIFLFRGPYLII
jgi:hypothetical protein